MRATSRAPTRLGNRRPAVARRGVGRDAGMATVEAAIALCGFVAVVAVVLAGFSAVLGEIRCTDAAREAARLVARGDLDRAEQVARRIAPAGAHITIAATEPDANGGADSDGGAVTVTVVADPVDGLLPGVHVRADAYAVREPEPVAAPAAAPPGPATARGDR